MHMKEKKYTQNIRLCFNKDISFFNNIYINKLINKLLCIRGTSKCSCYHQRCVSVC